jgi:hypothetical protein
VTEPQTDDSLGLFRGLVSAACLYLIVGCGIMATIDGWPWTAGFLVGVAGLLRMAMSECVWCEAETKGEQGPVIPVGVEILNACDRHGWVPDEPRLRGDTSMVTKRPR